jgi:hypothetical protein
LLTCGGLAIRLPAVGARPNFHERLSRIYSR